MKQIASSLVTNRRKSAIRCICSLLLIFLGSLLLLVHPANSQQPKETKQVLILISGQKDLPGYILSEKGMRTALDQSIDFQVEYFMEYMDRYRFNDASYQKDLLELYRTKYSSKKIDLVIAHGYDALDFAVANGDDIFPNTPVFGAVLEEQLKRLNCNQKYTGFLVNIDYLVLLNSALENHPETRRVAIISGAAKVGRIIEKQSRDAFAPYTEKNDFIFLGHPSFI